MKPWHFLAAAAVIVAVILVLQPRLFDRAPMVTKTIDGVKAPIDCPIDDQDQMRFTCNSQTHKCWCGHSEDQPK